MTTPTTVDTGTDPASIAALFGMPVELLEGPRPVRWEPVHVAPRRAAYVPPLVRAFLALGAAADELRLELEALDREAARIREHERMRPIWQAYDRRRRARARRRRR